MATATTNTILTQIALKRLSGKALTSGKQSLPQEPFGSTVQSSTTTIFGQVVPNTANTNESDLFYIQSASAADPGTVQLVDFDLIPLSNGKYQNVTDVDNDTEESGYNADTGVTTVDTFHAYMLRLTGSYEADTNAIGATYFADNASTDKVLGTAPEYSDNFIASASVQFQVVPEYLSTEVGSANPYAPKVIASDGSSEIAFTDSARNMYFDAFSGILFVQDPVDYGTTTSGVDGFDAGRKNARPHLHGDHYLRIAGPLENLGAAGDRRYRRVAGTGWHGPRRGQGVAAGLLRGGPDLDVLV